MPGVAIRGVGLNSALGLDAQSCVEALLTVGGAPTPLTLQGLAEPVQAGYFRIPDGADLFDPQRFARLMPAVVQAATAEARLSTAELRALPVYVGSSCFSVGRSESDYAAALAAGSPAAYPMPHCGYGGLADLARRALGSAGEVFSYNTACTSSANALLGATRALQLGRHRHALVIGAELANRTTLAGFAGLQLLAQRARPFEAEREGIVLGEAIGAVLLAAEPGADELCLHGGADNCDTHSVTTANPDGESVQAVSRQALRRAGLEAAQVRGIKAHGTASPSSDLAEAAGLRKLFAKLPPLSVLKPHIGHTLGACGVVELILYASALQRGLLPAWTGFGATDPELGVLPLTRPAPAPAGHYLLNHFGFGGNNAVLVMEKRA
jgi:3-oxoacyl-[acyl-carrier-protein] synthase I